MEPREQAFCCASPHKFLDPALAMSPNNEQIDCVCRYEVGNCDLRDAVQNLNFDSVGQRPKVRLMQLFADLLLGRLPQPPSNSSQFIWADPGNGEELQVRRIQYMHDVKPCLNCARDGHCNIECRTA